MICAKIHAVMQRVEKIRKDLENPHHKYRYIGHDDVTIAVRTAFAEVGIVQTVSIIEALRLDGGALGMRVRIRWTDAEVAESFVEVESYGESGGEGKSGKFMPQPQQVGIALSYAVKIAQLKNFCLVGDNTPDVEEQHGPKETAREPTPEQSARAYAISDGETGGWNLSGNGSKNDDPPLERPTPEATPFETMLAGFEAVSSLKRFDQMMKKCVPLLSGLTPDERKQLETVALRARKRLTSAEANSMEESR